MDIQISSYKDINEYIKNMTYNCTVGDYLSDSWNNIVCLYAKNDANIPINWLKDLERINSILETKILPLMALSKDSRCIYDKDNRLLGVSYKDFLYMSVNKDNTYYIDTICKNNRLKTAKDIETKEYSWKDIELALRVLDDFSEYGYNIDFANEYYRLKETDKSLLIKALDCKTIKYNKENKPYVNGVKVYKFLLECINKNELNLAVSIKDSFNILNYTPNYIKIDKDNYLFNESVLFNDCENQCRDYCEFDYDISYNIDSKKLSKFMPCYFENPITKEKIYLPFVKDEKNKFISFEEINEEIKKGFFTIHNPVSNEKETHSFKEFLDIDINNYIESKDYNIKKDKMQIKEKEDELEK